MKHALTTLVVCSVLAGGAMANETKWEQHKSMAEKGFIFPDGNSRVAGESCNEAFVLDCGQTLAGNTTGTDYWYTFTLSAQSSVSLDLTFLNADADLDLFLYGGTCAGPTSLGSSTTTTDNELVYMTCLDAGTYFVRVDFWSGLGADYSLNLACNDCQIGPVPCVPLANALPIECGIPVNGTNDLGCTSSIDAYSCVSWSEEGPEQFYQFFNPIAQRVTVALTGMTADLDVFLLPANGNPAQCMAFGDSGFNVPCLAPGIYYISVDGYNGAVSAFTLSLNCEACPPDPCTGFAPVEVATCGVYDGAISTTEPMDWYLLTVTGCDGSISTCNAATFDSKIWVYPVGAYLPCNALFNLNSWILNNDDFSGCAGFTSHLNYTGVQLPAGSYWVRIARYSGSVNGTYTVTFDSNCCPTADTDDLPVAFELGKAFPNPFNPSTTINFTMGETANANLTVYNMNGQAVATLVDGVVGAGAQSVVFDASELTSGVYFYTLNVAGQSMTEKMVLVK